ncbi:MAG: VCBS repeat-containing protein [Ignavibacteria bacterium]|nr:VCBS repeat-containing protein [Ignavibacteria bacterium]
MKKLILFIHSVFIIAILFSFIFKPSRLITYTESSYGLQTINLESGRTEIEMEDINDDGFKDILSIGDHGSPYVNSQEHGIMVWFGNGTGSNWSIYQMGNFGYGGIAVGDANNDGFKDVGYGIHHDYSSTDLGDQLLEVALGDGSGMNWTAWDDSLASQGETWGMFGTDFGDVNNDGLLDVGSISFGCCAGVHVYKNLGTGTWRQTFGFIGGNSTMEFYFGDFNKDGNLDFAVTHQYGTPYFGDGTGNFTLKHNNLPAPGNIGLKGVSIGDVDKDGADDLSFIGTSGSVQVWTWNESSLQWNNLSGNLPSSSSYSATVLYDMDMDGFKDIVLFGSGTCTVYGGNGGSTWTQIASFTTPPSGTYSDITVGDADNNGYPDIAILAKEGSWPSDINRLRFFKESSTVASLVVIPDYPIGAEKFKENSIRFIKWISAVPPGANPKVKLELSSTGITGPWILIADSLPNNGRYQWQVPGAINSTNCFIRYTLFIPDSASSVTSITPNAFTISGLVGLTNQTQTVNKFKLFQNYPNPFNPYTTIKYIAPLSSFINLRVYDINGREIKNLYTGEQSAGEYELIWDGKDFSGNDVASGIYFIKLKAVSSNSKEFIQVRKMMLLR